MHDELEKYDTIIVGAGLSGAVLAERLASQQGSRVLIIDKRDHIGGNCYDYLDEQSGLIVSKYGPHLFHTDDQTVWDYVNQFDTWIRWEHQVKAYVDGDFVPVPVNMTTINRLCGEHLKTPEETDKWLNCSKNSISIDGPESLPLTGRDVAIQRVGPTLYKKLFENYTYKQWAKFPEELDGSILARIPVRTDCDPRYFTDRYQALPSKGYTHFFEQLLDHPKIDIRLSSDYFDTNVKESIDAWKNQGRLKNQRRLIFTGPIDQYYASLGYPRLEYRSLKFEQEFYPEAHYYQPTLQVNYPSLKYPFTRIVEYKHLPYNSSSVDNRTTTGTIIVKEFSTDEGEPYYPVVNKRNLELYQKYRELADQDSNRSGSGSGSLHFVGRLANFKYFNMDQAIKNALDYYQNHLADK